MPFNDDDGDSDGDDDGDDDVVEDHHRMGQQQRHEMISTLLDSNVTRQTAAMGSPQQHLDHQLQSSNCQQSSHTGRCS